MGLVCEFDLVADIFGMAETPELGLPIDYSEACETFINVFLEEARDAVPVDTGNLLGSINGSTDGDGYVIVEADAEYAQYVEFGTYKMDAQPYFIPACQKAWQAMKSAAREAIDEALNEEQQLLEEQEEQEQQQMGGGGGGFGSQGSFLGSLGGLVIAAIIVGLVTGFMNLVAYDDSENFKSGGGLPSNLSGGASESAANVEHFIYIT